MKNVLKIRREYIQKGLAYLFCVLLCVFLITKVHRAYSGSEVNGGIWNVIQICFILSGFVLMLERTQKNPISIRIFSCYAFWVMFLSVWTISDLKINTLFEYATIPYGVMVMLIFYGVGKHLSLTRDYKMLQLTFYVLAALIFVAMRNWRLLSDDKGAVADVYYVLGLLPLMLVFVKQKFQIVPIIVTLIVILLTGKRAGLLAIIVMLLVFYWLQIRYSDNIRKSLRTLLLLVCVACMMGVTWVNLSDMYDLQALERLQKLETDGGSGRSVLWAFAMEQYINGNFLQLWFGRGQGSVEQLLGNHAHNDFIEVLYNYGLVACLLYVGFYMSLFRTWKRMCKTRYRYSTEFLLTIIAALFLASFSFYVIDPTYITCGAVSWGLFLADWEKQKREQTNIGISYAK